MGLARFILRVPIVNTIPAAIRPHRITTILTSTNRRASTVSVALRSRWIGADLTRRHRKKSWRRLRPLRVERVRSDLSSMIQRYAQAMS
jgi:hypothetical protein